MLASLADQLFVLFQRLLPARLLGRLVRAVTRSGSVSPGTLIQLTSSA